MFASICNFNEFWLAVQGNGHGYGCLRILNEIIADFDELLTQPAFVEVEKIKTIGSTYMTCVGLSPVQKVRLLKSFKPFLLSYNCHSYCLKLHTYS